MMDNPDEMYKHLLDELFDGIYFVDRQRNITYWNKGAEQISGFSQSEVLGKWCGDKLLMHVNEEGKSLCDTDCPLLKVMQDGSQVEANVYLHHKEGHRVPVRIRVKPIINQDGEIIGALEVFSDNTIFVAARRRLDELQYLADRDALTGVGNRRFSEISLSAALMNFRQSNNGFGLLFIDVDHFKNINDTYGHLVGDQMLRVVADTMRYSVRTSDYIGRWGGEEFIIILYQIAPTQLQFVAEKLRSLVEKNTLITEKGEVGVTVSIGGTMAEI
ncbi:MAG: diguanylate cyclase domain-containing protein, partial [Anaerolineales bacterium]